MTKGAGMIHPNMATLLGILCTDAPVSPEALQSLLTNAVDRSFNCISIDGDTSTNDTVAILANGAAAPRRATRLSAAPVLIPNDPQNEDYAALQTQLTSITAQLAQLIIRDGEGATKFVEIRVRGAPSRRAGHRVASSIARSPLVKTALYGKDANWGRILCAIGYTENLDIDGVIEPTKVSVSFVAPKARSSEASGELRLLVNGEPQDVDEARAARVLEEEDLEILVKLDGEQEGKEGEVNFWTCDFSHEVCLRLEYIRNAFADFFAVCHHQWRLQNVRMLADQNSSGEFTSSKMLRANESATDDINKCYMACGSGMLD